MICSAPPWVTDFTAVWDIVQSKLSVLGRKSTSYSQKGIGVPEGDTLPTSAPRSSVPRKLVHLPAAAGISAPR